MIVFFFILTWFFDVGGSYLGLFIYIILPVFLIIGLVLIPVGMLIRVRRLKKNKVIEPSQRLIINFNDRKHRNAFVVFLIGTVIFLFLSAIGSYEAFNYTESVEFCGMCHEVMEPEHTAYQNSPHASVSCVECHVGPGADWYVRSKLSGLYQVYSVMFKKYPSPIPTPIHNLRPAKETCLECHWPEKFYAHKLAYEKHFLADSANTEWNIKLRMKIGPSHSSQGLSEGIHWHIDPNIKIEYIAASTDRETIPWVRYINLETGDTLIYHDSEDPIDPALLASEQPRTMDCMDCHNRPSHVFLTPQDFVDEAIAEGKVPSSLPFIKYISMQIFNEFYNSVEEAEEAIKSGITGYYEENFPEILTTRPAEVDLAIQEIFASYRKNIFPKMKASWDVYPDHIGHMEYNGCFRCHNDRHETSTGRVISKDCNLCHTILLQGTNENLQVASLNDSLEFLHPVYIKNKEKTAMCADCHRYLYQ
jgi:nitrate/TMAO reductase-like tetraheme cytochrome c subunit